MSKVKFKNLLPFSVKRRIAGVGVGILRIGLRAGLSGAARFGFNAEHAFSQRFMNFTNFLQVFPRGANSLEAGKHSSNSLIAVFFDSVPKTGKDSANVRMFAILKALAQFSRVVLVTIYRQPEDYPAELELNEIGVEVVWAIDFERRFKRERCDAVILSYPFVADYMFSAVKRTLPDAKIIYDTVDVHFLRLEREFELTRNARFAEEAARLKQIEVKLAKSADAVWCVTENDKKHLLQAAPEARIEVVPNIHTLNGRGKYFAERKDLMFIGNYSHRPNADAVFYFLDEIFPLLLERLPDIKFYAVGNEPTPEIRARASKNVIVTGFVADVAPYFENCRVFVAPLRYGAGMKGKIGQALSFGLPTVTTRVGAEGMNLTGEREILLADDARQFATQILRVYDDKELWQKLADNGYNFIAENLSPAAVEQNLRCTLKRILPNIEFSTL